MKSSSEISNEIAQKEKEINIACNDRDLVKLEINSKRRNIHEIQIIIKTLEDKLIKAESNIRDLKTQHSILKTNFWETKEQGL